MSGGGRHSGSSVFVFGYGYPSFSLYYPYYGYYGLGGFYGYYPGYVYAPTYAQRNDYKPENRPARPASLAQELTIQWQRNGKLLVSWTGEAGNVQQVEFSLLDSDRQLLELRVVRTAPYTTTFSSPLDSATYLQIAVVYADGSVDSVARPLPDGDAPSERSGR